MNFDKQLLEQLIRNPSSAAALAPNPVQAALPVNPTDLAAKLPGADMAAGALSGAALNPEELLKMKESMTPGIAAGAQNSPFKRLMQMLGR